MRRRLVLLAIPAVLALVLPTAGRAAFHNRLVKSDPAADSTVKSPRAIRLWFAEKVDAKLSSITVMTADSTKVDAGKARTTDDPKSIAVDLAAPLGAGAYQVVWRTAGDDGHAVRGRFRFSVE
ncbi:MAG: copper resistance protein CopC [Gemmatimonadales bacterium]